MLNFDAKPPPKCKHCKRHKGDHQAGTLNCPMTRHAFTNFFENQRYEPKPPNAGIQRLGTSPLE